MKTNLIFGFLLAFSGLSDQLMAQENFLPGYVVTNQSDTVYGYIDFRDWNHNPKAFTFKTAIDEPSKELGTDDISLVALPEERFVSAQVEVSTVSRATSHLTTATQQETEQRQVFLQQLVGGDKSLFYLNQPDIPEQFYIYQNQTYTLLVYKKYLAFEKGRQVIAEGKRYLGQLSLYFQECRGMETTLENTEYTQRSLQRAFDQYYSCVHVEPAFLRAPDVSPLRWGGVMGVSLTQLTFEGRAFDHLINTDFKPSINVTAGLLAELKMPRKIGKWSFANELLLTSYKANGTYVDSENDDYYTISTMYWKSTRLKLNNLIRYRHPFQALSVIVDVGMSNSLQLSGANDLKKVQHIYGSTRTTKGEMVPGARAHEQGLVLGVGVGRGKLAAQVRYELANGMSVYNHLKSRNQQVFLLMTYVF